MAQSPTQNYADYDGCLTEWYDRVPKIELHLHLEGSIPLDSLWELINKYGGDSDIRDIQSLKHRFQYKDFTFFSEAIAKSLADQSIRYFEALLSPARFFETGLETGRPFFPFITALQGSRPHIVTLVKVKHSHKYLLRNTSPYRDHSVPGTLGRMESKVEFGVDATKRMAEIISPPCQ